MSCGVDEATELILQAFRRFMYVTAHSPTLPSLYLRHNSFSNPSVALPMSQFILQPFFRFSYVTSSSLNSPGEPPMIYNKRLYSNYCRIYSFNIHVKYWEENFYLSRSLNLGSRDLSSGAIPLSHRYQLT